MRVVAGKLRGRTIKSVPGTSTRPTLDKVKESVFNALGQFFDSGVALDLFAGSGNLGIEAISRGVTKCVFVDMSVKATEVIRENIKQLGITESSEILKIDAFSALYLFENKFKFDFVFLDPPYQKQKINDIIQILVDKKLLNEEALVVCECLKEDTLIENYKTIQYLKEYIYGITKITIYRNKGEENV